MIMIHTNIIVILNPEEINPEEHMPIVSDNLWLIEPFSDDSNKVVGICWLCRSKRFGRLILMFFHSVRVRKYYHILIP